MRTKNETIREDILNCAIEQFSLKGYTAVNMAEIAEELHISRAPLYYYFSNKAELYKSTIKYCIEQQKSDYSAILCNDKSFKEMLKEDFLYCLQDKGLFGRIGKGGKDEPDLNEEYDEFRQWLIDLKYHVFAECQKRGEIPQTTDLSELITFIYVYYFGIINTNELAKGLSGFNRDMLENSVDMFLELIESKFLS